MKQNKAFFKKGRRHTLITLASLGFIAFMHVLWNASLRYLGGEKEFPWYSEIYFTGKNYIPFLLILVALWAFLSIKLEDIKEKEKGSESKEEDVKQAASNGKPNDKSAKQTANNARPKNKTVNQNGKSTKPRAKRK